MTIFLVGDIVGSPGRRVFAEVITKLKSEMNVHAIVANAENAAAGHGLTMALAQNLLKAGADVLTMGDHVWGQKELEGAIGNERRILRPANFPSGAPGRGFVTIQTDVGPLTVLNLLGRVFMGPMDCPFRAADDMLQQIPRNTPVIVDFHAEATSEKVALGHYLDGRVTAVVGTHTHIQTSDARLLPKGTAYMTDLGMTGPLNSVIGRDITAVLRKFTTAMPGRLEIADGPCVLEGALLEINRETGRAEKISAYRYQEGDC